MYKDDVDVGMWMLLFWHRRRFLAGLSMFCCIVTALYTLTLPNTYTSSSKLFLPSGKGDVGLAGMLGTVSTLAGISTSMQQDTTEFYKEIIQSRTIIERLIKKFDLISVYGFKNTTANIELLTGKMKNSIAVTQLAKSGFIELSVETLRPELAQSIATEIIIAANESINRLNIAKAKEKRIFLEKRVGEVYDDIRALQKRISDFYESRGIFEITEQSRRSIETVAQLLQQIESLRVKLDLQASAIGQDHPEYRATELELREMSKRFHLIMNGRTDESQFSQTDVDGSFSPLLAVEEIPELNFENMELSREMSMQANLLTLIRQQFELAKIEEKKEDLFLRTLDAPTLPFKRTSPKRMFIVMFGGFIGLIAGVGYLVALENWKRMVALDHQSKD